MLPDPSSVLLARIQFGAAASFHFLFVPLTLGLAWVMLTMEIAYVRTGKEVYKDMVRFWGKLFGINFAMGVLTGLTLEFQFGTNWAYYSQYVGDIFGTPLAIEGLVAFMLESTFLGLFFFGWNKLNKYQHLFATFCLAFGSSLSALFILIANGYMQHPVGSAFNFETMRMETISLLPIFFSRIGQIGFAHTILAGLVTGCVFVLGISSYYICKKQDLDFAKRSFAIAAGVGIIASFIVMLMGDQNGLIVNEDQHAKLAAMEAEWETQKPPASFNLIAFPSQSEERNLFAIKIPAVLGLLVTHSTDTPIPGIKEIIKTNEGRIRRGMTAYKVLVDMRENGASTRNMSIFNQYKDDLGYGLLLKRYTDNVVDATEAQIIQASKDTIPNVAAIYWSFRVMVGFALIMFFMFICAVHGVIKKTIWEKRWFFRLAVYSIPIPFITCIFGWFVTEHGRQPWTISGVLPTTLSSSSLSASDLALSLFVFIAFYSALFITELYLMFKYARRGPSSLHLGRYHFETSRGNA